MVRMIQSIALAGALFVVAAPAFADDINLNPLGIDLDPFHLLTPAPPAPAPAPPVTHHHLHHHIRHH